MTTGFPKATSVKSEIINIKQRDSFCNDFPDSPIENQNAISGGVSNNLPVICGGDGGQQKCYSLGSVEEEEVVATTGRLTTCCTNPCNTNPLTLALRSLKLCSAGSTLI